MSDKYDLAVRSTDEIAAAGDSYTLHNVVMIDANGVPVKDSVANFVSKSGSVAASLSAAGLPNPATADTYLKRNAGNTAYDAKTAAQVLADIMAGTTANTTDIVLGKRMTNPNQVAFRVKLSAEQSNVTGDGTAYKIPFDSASGTDLFNRGNCFDTSTFEFSAPVTGLYVFNAYIRFRGLSSSHTSAEYELVTSNGGQSVFGFFNPYALQASYGGNELCLNGSCILPMDAGDVAYVQATIYGGTKDADCRSSSFFSGYLLS